MPLRLNQMHPLDALYQACRAYPGGIEALAVRVGKSPAILYNKLRQQVATHHVGYDDELSELLFCMDEAGVKGWADTLHAFCWRHHHLAVSIPPVSDAPTDELTAMILEAVADQGKVAESISDALANDRQVDSAEFREIEKRISKTMTDLSELLERIRQMHTEAKEKGLVR